MVATLIFPEGVRLAYQDELPGSEETRTALFSRIASANIQPGYVFYESNDDRFEFFAEANVDAPDLWSTFCDLCRALLTSEVTLLFGDADDDNLCALRSGRLENILNALRRHSYQLVHDGYVQFGLVSEEAGALNEVFVVSTKHMKIWLHDKERFRSIMTSHGVSEADHLEFLDNYPRTTSKLLTGTGAYFEVDELARQLATDIDKNSDDL